MPLEPIFLMDLDVHAADGSLTDRVVAIGALSQNKVNGLPTALSDLTASIVAEAARAVAAEQGLEADISAEEARALLAEQALQGAIDAEEARAMAAEGVLSSDLAAETGNRIAADGQLQAAIDQEVLDRQAAIVSAVAGVNGDLSGLTQDLNDEVARAQAEEASIRADFAAADVVLQSVIDAEVLRAQGEEADIRVDFAAGDVATLASAEAYTDQKISDLVNSAPAMLDTLGEIATALQDEQSATASILTAISNEVTRATAAEGLLDGRLDVIEAKQWRQAVILSSVQGTTTLAKPVGAPAIPNSGAEVQAFIDGRKVFFGSQFSVDVGGGGITFPQLRANQTVELLYWA
jgi:hypothetical protein